MSRAQKLSAVRLGSSLRKARGDKSWTLEQLRDESGIGLGTISELENGKYLPTTNTLLRLASALGVSLHDLTGS